MEHYLRRWDLASLTWKEEFQSLIHSSEACTVQFLEVLFFKFQHTRSCSTRESWSSRFMCWRCTVWLSRAHAVHYLVAHSGPVWLLTQKKFKFCKGETCTQFSPILKLEIQNSQMRSNCIECVQLQWNFLSCWPLFPPTVKSEHNSYIHTH